MPSVIASVHARNESTSDGIDAIARSSPIAAVVSGTVSRNRFGSDTLERVDRRSPRSATPLLGSSPERCAERGVLRQTGAMASEVGVSRGEKPGLEIEDRVPHTRYIEADGGPPRPAALVITRP